MHSTRQESGPHLRSMSLLAAALVAVSVSVVMAGDLEPPGPPGPTMKTLDEAEPRIPIHDADLPLTIVEDRVARGNLYSGIFVGNQVVVRNCISRLNINSGILTADDATVLSSVAVENGSSGILTGANSVVADCTANGNSFVGVFLGASSIVRNTTANGNVETGIFTYQGETTTVRDCLVSGNGLNGIEVSSNGQIIGNTAYANGMSLEGAGILVSGTDNRVEGNHAAGNYVGIDVGFFGNVVIRNTVAGNTTDFDITSGNFVGTIVTTEAAMNGATNDLVNIVF